MPESETLQGILFLIQGHLNNGELREAINALDRVEIVDPESKIPYELIISHCGKNEKYEEIIELLKLMESRGLSPDYDTYAKFDPFSQ